MQLDFDDIRLAFTHGGIKGSCFEEILVSFLRPLLPSRIGICTGQVIDSLGNYSKQLDLILYDQVNAPTLKIARDIRLLPVECVFGVIEVKAKLTGKEIQQVFDNMESVRRLNREAVVSNPANRFLQLFYQGCPMAYNAVCYFCFAFGSNLRAENIASKLETESKQRKLSPGERLDLVSILGKGTWVLDGVDFDQYQLSSVGTEVAEFYLRVHSNLSKAIMAGFLDIDRYLGASPSAIQGPATKP